MTQKEKIIAVSDEILTALLEFKEAHPEFTCSLRSRDSVQSKEVRLGSGQWFQGSDYIYVPLFNRGDSARKIKTIGFVIGIDKEGNISDNNLQISFKGGSFSKADKLFHEQLSEKLGVELNKSNWGNKPYDAPEDYLNNLNDYLTRVRPIALELLDQHNLTSSYVVKEETFQKSLRKINEIKKELGIKSMTMESSELDSYIKVLMHKKQIILQGPPGTGKTFMAKKIARAVVGHEQGTITYDLIKKTLIAGTKIPNASGVKDYFTIKKVNDNSVVIFSDRSEDWEPFYSEIISKYNEISRGISPQNKKGKHPYELAVAKYLHKELGALTQKENYDIVQFHPSYTYEDFVRGITAKNEGGSIVYETENKLLAILASKAKDNLDDANRDVAELSKQKQIEDLLKDFSEDIQDMIDEKGKYPLTESVSITSVDEDAFRYGGDWQHTSRMKFNDLVLGEMNGAKTRQEFKNTPGISGLAFQHATYFSILLAKFNKQYGKALESLKGEVTVKPEVKNYVLIIDEINRANLPSVLGELIYALEYRNEPVQSMYAIDGDNTLIIPENLFIIGTMNTADRSVGHIDYAIKRRFGFVDVLPSEDVIENTKAKELFNLVASLFVETKDDGTRSNSIHLASDFNYKDVQLGHSYFLLKEGPEKEQTNELKIRLDYEIIPILNEYIKDGLLLESSKDKIEEIKKFEC